MTNKTPCEHCFCEEIYVNNKKHRRCCMCGVQRLAELEITWQATKHTT